MVDDSRPERTAVVLAPGAAGEDGLLQLREVVELELDGQLVILSACRSASGELVEGEGVMGLARAFFQAGARAVIGSLWPLRDDEGAALAEELSRELARGRGVAGSLAVAQRRLAERGFPAATWSALIVFGDGDLAPIPARTTYVGTLLGAAATLVGVAVLITWIRHRRRARP